jgi:hypothetical protein
LRGLLEWFRVQSHLVHAAVAPAPEQSGLFQHTQMFRDGRQGHRMRTGQARDAFIAPGEMREDLPPGGIGQRREDAVQSFRGMFNHLVNYYPQRNNCANNIFAGPRRLETRRRERPSTLFLVSFDSTGIAARATER